MSAVASTGAEPVLLACALAAALIVRPWRMLGGPYSVRPLATPLLAALTLLPWLWSWPASASMPVPLQWSGTALTVLALGWPLAVPVLAVAGLSTVLTADATWTQAISNTFWLGVFPATAVLLLGHAMRRTLGTHPAVYLLGRAFAIPLLAVFACTLAAAAAADHFRGADSEALVVTAFLMAMAEAASTCTLVSILVAWRPQWLATWSDTLYLGPSQPVRH